jgi:hypothetical protein
VVSGLRLGFALCLLAFVSASALEPPPPYFHDAEQDGKGVVWAFNRDEHHQLFAYNGKQWRAIPAPFPAREYAEPARLCRMTDGSVVCLWRVGPFQMAFTRHLGTESKLLAECPKQTQQTGLEGVPFCDSKNRIWIPGQTQEIHRVDQDGQTMDYKIQPEKYLEPGKVEIGAAPIYAVEDGRGRIWTWSYSCEGHPTYASLRGCLIFDGEKVEHRERIDGIKGKNFAALVRKDARHMWLSVANEGLFEVDIETMKATPVIEPEPKALRCLQSAFKVRGDWFFISKPGYESSLWRLHEGQWTHVLDKLGTMPDHERAWLNIGKDLFLCAETAPWLIRPGVPPARLDWEHGFLIDGAKKIFRLADGTLFALGEKGTFFHGKFPLAPEPVSRRRVTEIKVRYCWTLDSTGNIWWVSDDHTTNILYQWNGECILKHALPHAGDSGLIQGVTADLQGRIWLLPNSGEKIAGFFDSRIGKWQTFPRIEDAYQSVQDDPPEFWPQSPGEGHWDYIPRFSADHRRIAFRDGDWQTVYFDGEQWRRWKRSEVAAVRDSNDTMLGTPFFNAKGALCVNTRFHGTLQFEENGKWIKTELDNPFTEPFTGNNHPKVTLHPPDGSPTKEPDSIVRDNLGALWFNEHGHLYKCVGDACVEIFSPKDPNPFTTYRIILRAAVGRGGNVFLQTGYGGWFMIAPKSPPPKTSIVFKQIVPDSVQAKLDARSRSRVQFRWQLDDGPSQLTRNNTLLFDSLPNGTHTLTASATDEELQSDATPTVAKFEIRIDPDKQIAAFVQRLADPDFAKRESAVAALLRQPDLALLALKNARDIASDDQRWWIDATIQEIERKASTVSKSAIP